MDAWDFPAALLATWMAIAFFMIARRNAKAEAALGSAGWGDWAIILICAAIAGATWFIGLEAPFWGDFAMTFFGIFIGAAIVLIAGQFLRWLRREPQRK